LKERWGGLDFLVHAIGYSDKNELRGKFVDTSLDNFLMTMNISVYSFVAVDPARAAMMNRGGSMLTLTYYGAEKVIPHYNVMGVAKAALETASNIWRWTSGPRDPRQRDLGRPIKTLAASGIGDFRYIMKWNEYNSRCAATSPSRMSAARALPAQRPGERVTGEIHHVDAGLHVVGMKAEDAPDIATV
jgi:enoyl-[acyl-carrier protein] reductase I